MPHLLLVKHSQCVSRLTGLAPFPLWKRLGLPSFVVLSLPDLKLQTILESMEV